MTTIFLSFANEQRGIAARVCRALRAEDYVVFFDEDSLPPGEAYHGEIQRRIDESDHAVILLSPEAIAEDSYARSELAAIKRKWTNPRRRVLPVQVVPVDPTKIDPYLQEGLTILRPEGSVAAEVVAFVRALGELPTRRAAEDVKALWEARVAAYRRLWQLTNVLPKWPRSATVAYADLQSFSGRLRDWYFEEGGGMFLTSAAHTRYAALQDALIGLRVDGLEGRLSDAHYDAIRTLCSSLRSQLAGDIGAR